MVSNNPRPSFRTGTGQWSAGMVMPLGRIKWQGILRLSPIHLSLNGRWYFVLFDLIRADALFIHLLSVRVLHFRFQVSLLVYLVLRIISNGFG
jgi:hypothetical protein